MRGLGILWVVYGLLRLIGALGVFLYSNVLVLMWGAIITRVPNAFAMMGMFHSFLVFVIILGIVAGVVSIIAGLGLMSRGVAHVPHVESLHAGAAGIREVYGASARSLGLLAAFFGLTNGPLGIALGAYTLVVLVPAGTRNP